MAVRFRFETMEIWQKAIRIGHCLLDIADELEERKLFRFADQMRGAALSVSNNIAKGSGSASEKEFANFLNIARRPAFENTNMVMVFAERGLIVCGDKEELLDALHQEAQMITGFVKSLRNRAVTKTVGLTLLFVGIVSTAAVFF